ncbi:MAG TPA: acyltransferase [Albitalea sp.]|nr:acyltransferase [Albitalea sp.]
MRIAEIDGLRAIAMTMVVAQHCALMPFGWTGVWLFFVISGYVITRGFMADEGSGLGPGPRFKAFMRRRALRIVPVYLLYVAVNVPILWSIGGASRLGDLPYLLTFTYNWHMIFGFWPGASNWAPFGHLWTLSVEQQFYLLFPLIALFLLPRAQIGVTLALIVAGPLLRWAASDALAGGDPGDAAFAIYAASLCHFDAFLIGSLVARLEPQLRASPRVSHAVWGVALLIAGVYAASTVAINYSLGARGTEALRNVFSGILYGQHREVFVYLAVDAVAAAALVHALLQRRGSRLLAWAPLAWVGQVSYGGYLFHTLVLWTVSQLLDVRMKELPVTSRLLVFVGVWAITVGLASASFQWFESVVARRWRRSARRGLAGNEPQRAAAV